MTNEWVDADNTTKWCKLSRGSFAVGALARVNNNHKLLHPDARKAAAEFGLTPVCHNPFMNNVAQLVEAIHVTHDAIRLIGELLQDGTGPIRVEVKPRAGEGVGAVEVPRGILYHHYAYDADGRVTKANCIIPTTQNNLNIHLDIRALAEAFAGRAGMTDERLSLLCSMLVRAYDPCISCSVH
jgi:coenzyme F420-reducing hydrogenase alpha subunit